MNLTSEKLIAILSEKLGKDEEWVTNELTRFVEEIRSAAEKGDTISIEKFGSFKDKNGRLSFDVDDTFALEINYKYAGMSAIELQPSESAEDQSEALKSTTEQAESDTEDASEVKTESEKEIEKEQKKPEQTGEHKEQESPFEEPQERKLEDILGITISAEDENEEKNDKKEEKVDVSKEILKKEEKVKSSLKEKQNIPAKNIKSGYKKGAYTPKKYSKKKSGSFITVMILIMIIVVVGLVVFIIYRNKPILEQTVQSSVAAIQNNTPPKPKTRNTNKVASTAMNPGTSTGNKEPSKKNVKVNNTRQQLDVKEKNKIIDELASTTKYGLKGKIKPEIKNFYTIVVYSLINENRADSQQKKFKNEGFRVVVTKADVDNTYLWRVGLGQFKSVQNAEKAATRLPSPFLSNHFIKRIQIR